MTKPTHFPVALIAQALGVTKPTVRKIARRQRWPRRTVCNRVEHQPPARIAARCLKLQPAPPRPLPSQGEPSPAGNRAALAKTFAREQAVLRLGELTPRAGIERALEIVAQEFAWVTFSTRSLRRWRDLYAQHGIAGLFEHKAGRVGRKPKHAKALR
jgi:hypothetical protein